MIVVTGKFDPIDQTTGGALEKAPREIWAVFMYGYGFNDEHNLTGRFARIECSDFYLYAYQADLNNFVDELEAQKIHGESGELLDRGSVAPYLKSYAQGFWDGYNNFKSIVEDETGVFGADMNIVADRIFREVTISHHVLSTRGYLNNRQKILKHDLFFENAKKVGASYRAWFYIVNNPKLFVQMFLDNFRPTLLKVEALLREYNGHDKDDKSYYIIKDSVVDVSGASNTELSELSAFEIALRHWYLVGSREEAYIVPKQVGEKYGHLRNAKNIEKAYGRIETGTSGNIKQLTNIQQSLSEYPQIQRAIENDIAKLQ